jgi:DNA invertase Pin-like site-specific DNA recombinase
MTPKEALKGKKVFIYARVSTDGQEGTLPDQIKTVEKGLKELGFSGKPEIFSEQFSGTKNPIENDKFRPQLAAMIEAALASKKPAVIVVRDIQRFSRDPYDLGELYNPLRRKDIPILSINERIVLGTKTNPVPQSDLIGPILVTVGGTEVSTRMLQTKQGLARSKDKGILQGSAPLFYRKEPLEPRRELRRMLQAGLGVLETSRRIGKSTSFVRKNRDKMQTILIEGNESSLQDWLDTLDLIRAYMNEKDEDDRGSKATKRMKTVVRMVSGYLNNPNAGFPKPTRADIEEYYNNFGLYKVKKKR